MSPRTRLLIVKTSSLGDVIHALPAISDVATARPDWEIDWVCEEAFVDVPRLHPAVSKVIPCALRRWRGTPWQPSVRREIRDFKAELRGGAYDVVLDLQGLVKSAWIVRQAGGVHCGYDWSSAREGLATLAYERRFRVLRGQHAIARNRQLAAAALDVPAAGPPHYGCLLAEGAAGDLLVAIHATSRADKLWPEAAWRDVISWAGRAGLRVMLPWGSEAERARSERLADGFAHAHVPARMSVGELARQMHRAGVAVGVDTGLVHLAAAVGAPTVAIFQSTDPGLTGVVADRAPAINLGSPRGGPPVGDVLAGIRAVVPGTSWEQVK